MGDLDRLLADGDLDGLLRLVDEACDDGDWDALEGVATRSRAAVERGHQYCFGQHRETDPQAGVDGFRDVSGPRIHPLGHIEGYLDGSGLPVGVPQEVAQVVFYAHPIEIFLEQLLRPAS